MTPSKCDCGRVPGIYRIRGSRLGLRIVGCKACHTGGPARMDSESAIVEWNKGRRVIVKDEPVLADIGFQDVGRKV